MNSDDKVFYDKGKFEERKRIMLLIDRWMSEKIGKINAITADEVDELRNKVLEKK